MYVVEIRLDQVTSQIKSYRLELLAKREYVKQCQRSDILGVNLIYDNNVIESQINVEKNIRKVVK